MGAITLATAARNAAAAAVAALVDAGSTAGYLEIRTGPAPASPQSPATGTLLVTIELNDPAYGAPASGVASLDVSPVPSGTAVATDTAGWARLYDGDDNPVADGLCSTSGAFVNLASTSFVTGAVVSFTSGSFTVPAA